MYRFDCVNKIKKRACFSQIYQKQRGDEYKYNGGKNKKKRKPRNIFYIIFGFFAEFNVCGGAFDLIIAVYARGAAVIITAGGRSVLFLWAFIIYINQLFQKYNILKYYIIK
jgi:hypothetical protein